MKHDLTISMRKQIAKTVAFLAASSFCVLSPSGLHGEDIPVPPAVVKTAPGTDTTNHTDPRQRVVSIARDGGVTVAGKRCKGSQLVAKLKELASKEPTTVAIHADKDAPYRSVTAVMDACKEAGVRVAEKVKTP